MPNVDSRVATLQRLIHHMWIVELPKKQVVFTGLKCNKRDQILADSYFFFKFRRTYIDF